MKKFGLHLLLTAAICVVLANCKHEPPPEPELPCQYDSSIEEMKKWYYFKTGSWWVYEEQTTGALDTLTVYYDWAGTNSSGTTGFEWYANSKLDGFNYYYSYNSSFSIHCLTRKDCTCNKVKRSKGKPGNFVGEESLFLYPIIEQNFSYVGGYPNGQLTFGTTTVTDVDLLFYIGSDTITNVVRWDVTTDQTKGGWPSVYHLAKQIGFVKIEHSHTNENWKLIAYQTL
jgi:hypothetical protein